MPLPCQAAAFFVGGVGPVGLPECNSFVLDVTPSQLQCTAVLVIRGSLPGAGSLVKHGRECQDMMGGKLGFVGWKKGGSRDDQEVKGIGGS